MPIVVVVVVVVVVLLSVVDPGEGPGGVGLLLILRPNWKPKGQKLFFWDPASPPHHFSQGVYDRAPPLSEMLDPPLIIILLLLIFFFLFSDFLSVTADQEHVKGPSAKW